mgnify:CR=1 FL=1
MEKNKETQNMSAKEQNMSAIAAINRVRDYSPEADAQKMAVGEDGEISYFLPLQKKKAWARMVYPEGTFRYEEVYPALSADMPFTERQEIMGILDRVIVIARFYPHASDGEANYIGEGYGVAYPSSLRLDDMMPEEQRKALLYPEMVRIARGQAESRALYNAGFGLQFYGKDEVDLVESIASNPEKVSIPQKADAPVIPKTTVVSANGFVPEETDPVPVDPPSFRADEPDEPQDSKRRRSYAQKYDDAADMLTNYIPQITAAQQTLLTANTEIEQTSARMKLEKLRAKWDKAVAELTNAINHSPASNPVKIRDDLVTDFDTIIDQVTDDVNISDDLALAELAEAEAIAREEAEADAREIAAQTATPNKTIVEEQMELFPENDARSMMCTFANYAGNTYGDLYDASKNILLWLADKVSEKEKGAVMSLISSDDELREKAARKGLL